MGIFDRMGRVVRANFNAVLDAAEDPKKSLEQTLREMKDQLRAAKGEVVRAVAAEKQLRKKLTELEDEQRKWEGRAELAIQHNDDDLARQALLQKRRVSKEMERTEQLRVEQRDNALEIKAEFERMEQKLEEFEAKKSALAAQRAQIKAGGGVEGLGAKPGGSAFAEFRRMEDEVDGVEAVFQAQSEVEAALQADRGPSGMSRDEVEAKFRALEYGSRTGLSSDAPSEIDDELQALKKKIRIK